MVAWGQTRSFRVMGGRGARGGGGGNRGHRQHFGSGRGRGESWGHVGPGTQAMGVRTDEIGRTYLGVIGIVFRRNLDFFYKVAALYLEYV